MINIIILCIIIYLINIKIIMIIGINQEISCILINNCIIHYMDRIQIMIIKSIIIGL